MRPLTAARRVGIVVAFVLVLLQPGFGERAAPTQVADLQVLVVVDRTRSMAALDHQGGPRVHGVQRDLTDLAAALPGARLALLTHGREATLELPFTSDTATFTTAVETMRIEGIFDGAGSMVDRPLDAMAEVLERAREQHPDRRRMVVFVSDGENTADGADQASFEQLADLVDGGVVLGYGTADGARMPEADDLSEDEGYVYDFETNDDAISRIDEENLQRVADEMGIDYVHRTGPGGMAAIADGFEASYSLDGEGRTAQNDLTWVFGLVLLGLVLLELRTRWRALWTSHRVLAPRDGSGT